MPFERHTPFGITRGHLTEEERANKAAGTPITQMILAQQAQEYQDKKAGEEKKRASEQAAGPFGNGDPFAFSADMLASNPDPHTEQMRVLKGAAGSTGLGLADEQTRAAMAHQRSMGRLDDLSNMQLKHQNRMDGMDATQRGELTRSQSGASKAATDYLKSKIGSGAPLTDEELLQLSIFAPMIGGKDAGAIGAITSRNQMKAAEAATRQRADQAANEDLLKRDLSDADSETKRYLAELEGKTAREIAAMKAGTDLPSDGAEADPHDPAVVFQQSPVIQRRLKRAIQALAAAGDEGGDPLTKTMAPQSEIHGVIDDMVKLGADPEVARIFVEEILEKKLPTTGWLSNPITSTLDALVPGQPFTSGSNRSRVRKDLGLTTFGE